MTAPMASKDFAAVGIHVYPTLPTGDNNHWLAHMRATRDGREIIHSMSSPHKSEAEAPEILRPLIHKQVNKSAWHSHFGL